MDADSDDYPNDFSILGDVDAQEASVPFTGHEAAASTAPPAVSHPTEIHPTAQLQLFPSEQKPSHAESVAEDPDLPPVLQLQFFNTAENIGSQQDDDRIVKSPDGQVGENSENKDSNLSSILSGLDPMDDSVKTTGAPYGQQPIQYLCRDPREDEEDDTQDVRHITSPDDFEVELVTQSKGQVSHSTTATLGQKLSSNPVAVQKHADGQVSVRFVTLQARGQPQDIPDEGRELHNTMPDDSQKTSKVAILLKNNDNAGQGMTQPETEDLEDRNFSPTSKTDHPASHVPGHSAVSHEQKDAVDEDISDTYSSREQNLCKPENAVKNDSNPTQNNIQNSTSVDSKCQALSAQRQVNRTEGDQEDDEEVEKCQEVSTDEQYKFSTPTSSPTFSQDGTKQSVVGAGRHQHNDSSQLYESPVSDQDREWSTPPCISPLQADPGSGAIGNQGYLHVEQATEDKRNVSPQQMFDVHQSMQSVDPSAFCPVPRRPAFSRHGVPGQHPLQSPSPQHHQHGTPSPQQGPQGYGTAATPPPQYQQHVTPPPQQLPGLQGHVNTHTPPPHFQHSQYGLQGYSPAHTPPCQQQHSTPQQQRYPSPSPAGVHPHGKEGFHRWQEQQQFYQQHMWQQQQMWQQWQCEQQQRMGHQAGQQQFHTPEMYGSMTASGLPRGTPQGMSSSDAGYMTPGYTTPQGPGPMAHPHLSSPQGQQTYGQDHPSFPSQPHAQAGGKTEERADTIRVSGVDEKMDMDLLQLYFESKKSGGDTVTYSEDHRSQGFILVTFEDPSVVERVVQRSHTVSKRLLTVTIEVKEQEEEEEEEKEPEEDFSCMVEVSGGKVVLNAEMMELYFESKKSEGGTISKIDLLEQAEVAIITFKDREVAEAVIKRRHVVSGTELTVVPYKPPGAPTKVKVSGLTSKASEELLQYYFEKKGECDVEDVQLDSERGEAVVTFDTPEAVQKILKQDHRVGGRQVTVSLLTMTHDATDAQNTKTPAPDPRTVEVRGLSSKTMEDTIRYYFENHRRSGGGSVESVQYEQGSGVARITFERTETVQEVLARQHKIDGKELQVSLCTRSPSPQVVSPSETAESEELNTVSVRGLSTALSPDSLSLYFESKKYSGGGNVTDVKLDTKKATFLVTFEDPQDAAHVASRSHTIQGQKAEVCLYRPPAMCKDRVILTNLPEVSSVDELLMYVELRSGAYVDTILFSDEEGSAVVIFSCDIDAEQVQASLKVKPFKKHTLVVDTVPISSTVLVSDLPNNPPVSQDTLWNYFENTRHSDGGEVTEVKVLADTVSALVTFQDCEVAARVSRRPHKIHGCPLNVNIYMECLGLSGGSTEPTVKIPPPLPISAADCQKIFNLQKLSARFEEFNQSLKGLYACLKLGSVESTSVACTLTPETEGVHHKVKSWAADVQHVLQGHLCDVSVEQVEVNEEEFAEAEGSIREVATEGLDVDIRFDAGLLGIVYKGEKQRHVVNKLVAVIRDAQQRLMRKKSEITVPIKSNKGKLLMLQKHTDYLAAVEEYPDICVTVHTDECQLDLRGPAEEAQSVRLKILEIMNNIISVSRSWDSDLHKELILQNDAARQKVESLCSLEGSEEVIEFTQDGFTVHSLQAQRAETVQMAAVSAVQRRVIRFDNDNRQATELVGWADLKRSILTENEGLMILDEDTSSLTLLSVAPSVQRDYDRLKQFLQENNVEQHTFPLPRVLSRLFRPYLQEKVIDLQVKLDDFVFDEDNNQIAVNGNSMLIDAAEGIYGGFCDALTHKYKTYTQPSMKEFFSMNEWRRRCDDIERVHRCLVLDPEELGDTFLTLDTTGPKEPSPSRDWHYQSQPFDLDYSLMTEAPSPVSNVSPSAEMLPRRVTMAKTKKKRVSVGGAASQPGPSLPARPRLYLSVMSDITKEEHHVLVNSANAQLNMKNGQVSKALLEVGGEAIQEELKANYPNGLPVGNIAVSSGGNLMCRKLIHCCLPEADDQQKISEVVRDAVMKCMAEADKLAMGSIGFPSLGTGNLGYPPTLVARTMFQAALDYGREHSDTSISDVFFILHKKDEKLQQVFSEEMDSYKQMLKDSVSHHDEQVEEEDYASVLPALQGIQSYKYFEETRGQVKKVIVGMDESALETADSELLAAYNDTITSLTVDVPHLENWDDVHKDTIKMACQACAVDVTLNFSLGKIVLHGFRDSLGRIPVHRAIKDAEADYNMKANASLLQQQVQWSCIEILEDGEHLLPYDMCNNYKIEMAYRNGEEKTFVTDSNNLAFIINFAKMEEIPETPDSQEDSGPMIVIRQDKIHTMDVPLPQKWSAMNGQDLDVRSVPSSTDEYGSVADAFLKSLEMPSAKIVRIDRIQNVMLYKQYHAMKHQMDSSIANKDKHCERSRLWHGTKESAVQGIIKYGFNRSYSDLAKSAYGQGAYFAVSAAYSSRNEYAVADPTTKERNMFMCKVLVGNYKKGNKDMRTPPEMAPGQLCHSTVDDEQSPQIFVTYSDMQAYPEYLIVFKDS